MRSGVRHRTWGTDSLSGASKWFGVGGCVLYFGQLIRCPGIRQSPKRLIWHFWSFFMNGAQRCCRWLALTACHRDYARHQNNWRMRVTSAAIGREALPCPDRSFIWTPLCPRGQPWLTVGRRLRSAQDLRTAQQQKKSMVPSPRCSTWWRVWCDSAYASEQWSGPGPRVWSEVQWQLKRCNGGPSRIPLYGQSVHGSATGTTNIKKICNKTTIHTDRSHHHF